MTIVTSKKAWIGHLPHSVDEPSTDDGEWYKFGLRHRDGGPAVKTDFTEEWYQFGELHREDGPARIRRLGADGKPTSSPDQIVYEWYCRGHRHREDGPAVIYETGNVAWYLGGYSLSFKEWLEFKTVSDEKQIELKLRYYDCSI